MNIREIKTYTDYEKLDLVNDYIDFMSHWHSSLWNYELFRSLDLNKRLKAKFLRFTVPYCFENLNYQHILRNCLVPIQELSEKVWCEYPRFYILSALVGALHCYWEVLTPKKILSRWSQILLNIY